jgi:hypothetical protein
MLLTQIKSFFSKHKFKALAVLAFVLVFGVGYWEGHSHVPVKTVIQEKVVEKIVTQVQTQVQTSDNVNDQKKDDENIHTVTTIVKKPDGTTTTQIVSDTNDDKSDTKVEVKYVDRVQTVTQTVEKTVEVTKTVETAKPNWMVKAMAGASFNQSKLQPTAPFINPIYLGLSVDRRIIGPVYLGAWGMTTTNLNNNIVGLSLSFQF